MSDISQIGRCLSNSVCQKLFNIIINRLKVIYIFVVNIQFLGKPSKENLNYVFSVFKEVFKRELSYFDRLFYCIYGRKLIHVFLYDGGKAGFALFRINPLWDLHLYSFALAESFKGKSLAKIFLSKSIYFWKTRGFKKLSLIVEKDNHVALKVYKSLGFDSVKILNNNDLYMEKKICDP